MHARINTIRIVVIGASAGGPMALQQLLSKLRPALPVPIVIVQHIATGFAAGLATFLNDTTGYRVQLAQHGLTTQAGVAYLAPDDMQLQLSPTGMLLLSDGPPENGVRPAVAPLFRSTAKGYGAAAIGILLTGMGRDGARELLAMREAGAMTLAQDRASAVVFGMPGEAEKLGAAERFLSPEGIAEVLLQRLR